MRARQARQVFTVLAVTWLAACATPARMYSVGELTTAGRDCGLAMGELVQEEEEPRLLFMLIPTPAAREQVCVRRWARRRSLTLVTIDGLERVVDAPVE